MSDNPITYAFDGIPEHGVVEKVGPGIFWVRMPLPFKLNHINLWLLEDGDGWTIVDTGFANDDVKALWDRIFDTVLDGRPVKRVIVTHFHPDHMGLAGWLTERFGVQMWTTLGEFAFARMLSLDLAVEGASRDVFSGFYRAAGFGPEFMSIVESRGNPYPKRVTPIPPAYIRMRDGDTVEINGHGWKVITGTGHSPEHACLYCEDLGMMISGDQILPRISPNVSVWPQEPESDPLALFLESIDRFRDLRPDTLVLPSHDAPFTGLDARLDQLAHHHDDRLEETFRACDAPSTGVKILNSLFTRELDDHQLFFAIGETLAHLHHLRGQGRLQTERGADGIDLWVQA
ncbi:MAG: MBL fold metallo-hydrolase [Rhodospirillales bacterium]|nr:MBL fold metallo-hydrolase [Rhodospirillales bacterium]MCW9001484.1 MBL fold metallo-hydrolase [Rhodospirillales bacterium]